MPGFMPKLAGQGGRSDERGAGICPPPHARECDARPGVGGTDPAPGASARRGTSRCVHVDGEGSFRMRTRSMGEVRPQSGTVREGLIPHRWTRVEDPGSVAVVAAYEAIIAGGGPAGLTAAYELSKHGKPCVVLEADPRMVG